MEPKKSAKKAQAPAGVLRPGSHCAFVAYPFSSRNQNSSRRSGASVVR
jgi:hypothetical protein